jgi:hypothetical protein
VRTPGRKPRLQFTQGDVEMLKKLKGVIVDEGVPPKVAAELIRLREAASDLR